MKRHHIRTVVGEDQRTVGSVNAVIRAVTQNPELFQQLIQGLSDAHPVVRMRAADAMEKISRTRPELLDPHKRTILDLARTSPQQELRWHFAQMLPRMTLSASERRQVIKIFGLFLQDKSRIVQANALQGLYDLALASGEIGPAILDLLEQQFRTGRPAVKARARKLLEQAGREVDEDEE